MSVLSLQGLESRQRRGVTPDKRKYLAKVGGKRKFYLDTPLYSQLCYSDPKVRELIAEEVVSYIEKHGEIDYLHVWLGDNYNNFCECESCRQKIPTDWYFMILNEIDRRLSALKKDTKIVFLIYFELLWPSQTVVLKNPDRFVLMFGADYSDVRPRFSQRRRGGGQRTSRSSVRTQ